MKFVEIGTYFSQEQHCFLCLCRADNIRIGNPDVSNEKIIMALKMSGCEEFIKAAAKVDTALLRKKK